MISKELLSEVLGYEPFKIDKIKQVNGVGIVLVLLNQDGTVRSYQNIYELAHKCKEWALNKGYVIESLTNRSCIMGDNYEYFAEAKIHKETNSMCQNTIDADTEIEAIFKACEWVRKEISK